MTSHLEHSPVGGVIGCCLTAKNFFGHTGLIGGSFATDAFDISCVKRQLSWAQVIRKSQAPCLTLK